MTSDPIFFLHIDLDGLWTLPGCYGYPEGREFTHDPVFTHGVERLLELLHEAGIRGTFFINGRDLELPEKAEKIKQICAVGHAFANHSYNHDLMLERREKEVIQADIERTQSAIELATGTRPAGFRAPGYGAGPKILEACTRAGLRYDGSLFPSRIGVLLRLGMGSLQHRVQFGLKDWAAMRKTKPPSLKTLFGGAERGEKMRLDPHQYKTPAGTLWRLPIAVTPTLRLPLQASLSINLGADRVVRACEKLVRRAGAITWLLHGMDVLGPEDLSGRLPPALARSRGFNISLEKRLAFLRQVLAQLPSIARPMLAEEWVNER